MPPFFFPPISFKFSVSGTRWEFPVQQQWADLPSKIHPAFPSQFVTGKLFQGGLCVKQFIWTCIVGLLLPVRYILDFGADLNRNMAALLHSSPLAGAGVWVICCCCWSRASFWVIIGTKHDISYYHVMWQVVWVTCTNSEWVGTELVCRRHCPCVEEDEGYLITDARRNESLKCGRFQYRQNWGEQDICTKPKLRMYLGTELVLKSSNHVCCSC